MWRDYSRWSNECVTVWNILLREILDSKSNCLVRLTTGTGFRAYYVLGNKEQVPTAPASLRKRCNTGILLLVGWHCWMVFETGGLPHYLSEHQWDREDSLTSVLHDHLDWVFDEPNVQLLDPEFKDWELT